MLVELNVVEQRLKAVLEVLDGATVVDVARRYRVGRQTMHSPNSPRQTSSLNRRRLGGRWVDGSGDRNERLGGCVFANQDRGDPTQTGLASGWIVARSFTGPVGVPVGAA